MFQQARNMRIIFLIIGIAISSLVSAQEERDTVLKRCPVFIIDTLTSNNFFLEFQPATIRVYRSRGKLTILIQQKDQFFTIFFKDNRLKNDKYKIVTSEPHKDEVEAKYSFRSGTTASYVSVSKGYVESVFDKEKDLWRIQVNGLLSNIAANTVSWYKVKADFYIY